MTQRKLVYIFNNRHSRIKRTLVFMLWKNDSIQNQWEKEEGSRNTRRQGSSERNWEARML